MSRITSLDDSEFAVLVVVAVPVDDGVVIFVAYSERVGEWLGDLTCCCC